MSRFFGVFRFFSGFFRVVEAFSGPFGFLGV